MKIIYTGWPGLKLSPDLAVELDPASRQFGWLFVKHADGQWVTLADLKPIAKEIVEKGQGNGKAA